MPQKLSGDSCYIKLLELDEDLSNYSKWLSDPEINSYLEVRFAPPSLQELNEYVNFCLESNTEHLFGIYMRESDNHIGNIKLGNISWTHRYADVGLLIGEKNYWGKGIGSQAIRLVTEFAFSELKLHKIVAGVYSNNIGSAKSFISAGYIQEGCQVGKYLSGDTYVDGLLYGILNPE